MYFDKNSSSVNLGFLNSKDFEVFVYFLVYEAVIEQN